VSSHETEERVHEMNSGSDWEEQASQIMEEGSLVRDLENINLLRLQVPRTRERRVSVPSGVVGVMLLVGLT
jgi:hypothetical protein